MGENIKEKKKRCPLCKKEYLEEYDYCRSDGQRLELVDSERETPVLSKREEEYAVDDFYLPKPV